MPWRQRPTSSARSTRSSGRSRRRSGWRSESTPASPALPDEGYVGMDVHVAARICSAAHGGQVVVSQATRDVAGGDAGLGPSRSGCLGDHRLKHVPTPQTLYQLVAPGLKPRDFPPLSTLGGSTLPALHHRLVGRTRDLAAAQALLARADVRLVTIAGPGGAGKSRLALEAACRRRRRAPRSPRRPRVHLRRRARAGRDRDASSASGSHRSAPLTELLADALEGTRSAPRARQPRASGTGAPPMSQRCIGRVSDLDILATSRSPLRLTGEHVVPLAPLPAEDATTLFFELAAAQGVPLDEDSLPAVRGDLPATRRPTARDRARRGPSRPALAGSTARSAGRRARPRDGGPRRSPATPANPARDARLELWAPDREPAAAPRPACGVRRGQHARRRARRGAGRPSGSSPTSRPRRREPAAA